MGRTGASGPAESEFDHRLSNRRFWSVFGCGFLRPNFQPKSGFISRQNRQLLQQWVNLDSAGPLAPVLPISYTKITLLDPKQAESHGRGQIFDEFPRAPLGKIRPKKWPIFDFLPACSHLKSGQMIFPFKRAFSGPKNRPRNGLSLPTEILAIWADARSNFSLLSFRSWILKFFQGSPLGKMSARCPSDVRQMSVRCPQKGDMRAILAKIFELPIGKMLCPLIKK